MLLRMLSSMSKWNKENNPIMREDPSYPADAVTDLKTTRNKLSVWNVDNRLDIEDAIVAMALGRQSLAKLWFVFLDEERLKEIGIVAMPDEIGIAPGIMSNDVLKRHMNLQHIDYTRLGLLTHYVFDQIASSDYVLKTRQELSALLEKYKACGKVMPNKMNDQLCMDLKWEKDNGIAK